MLKIQHLQTWIQHRKDLIPQPSGLCLISFPLREKKMGIKEGSGDKWKSLSVWLLLCQKHRRVWFQGCSLYSPVPRRKPFARTPDRSHTWPVQSSGCSSGFQLGWWVYRLWLKGQPHLWDKPFLLSWKLRNALLFPPSSLKETFHVMLIKCHFSGRQREVKLSSKF